MADVQEAPVVESPSAEQQEQASQAKAQAGVAQPSKVSPAQDLRDIQYLLLNGIFPGNVAPAVVKAYQLLEQMSVKMEASSESK